MKPSIEDIQWLRILDLNVPGDIPEFNKSRLIALGFAVREGDSIRVTERQGYAGRQSEDNPNDLSSVFFLFGQWPSLKKAQCPKPDIQALQGIG
jgi:hypothetical protein